MSICMIAKYPTDIEATIEVVRLRNSIHIDERGNAKKCVASFFLRTDPQQSITGIRVIFRQRLTNVKDATLRFQNEDALKRTEELFKVVNHEKQIFQVNGIEFQPVIPESVEISHNNEMEVFIRFPDNFRPDSNNISFSFQYDIDKFAKRRFPLGSLWTCSISYYEPLDEFIDQQDLAVTVKTIVQYITMPRRSVSVKSTPPCDETQIFLPERHPKIPSWEFIKKRIFMKWQRDSEFIPWKALRFLVEYRIIPTLEQIITIVLIPLIMIMIAFMLK